MTFNYFNLRGTGGRFLIFLCMSAIFSLQAKELKFEQAFSDIGEPAMIHFQVTIFSRGSEHQVEIWRSKQQKLKRRMDDAVEIYVSRKVGDSEYHMSILDMKKHIHTQIDRTNLYRIGNFTDWYDLSHGLKHPMGHYHLQESKPLKNTINPLRSCKWYDLTQKPAGGTSHICWDSQNHIPLVIQNQEGRVLWKVDSLDNKPISNAVFDIHDEGFIKNNANQDIDRD